MSVEEADAAAALAVPGVETMERFDVLTLFPTMLCIVPSHTDFASLRSALPIESRIVNWKVIAAPVPKTALSTVSLLLDERTDIPCAFSCDAN